MANWDYAKDVVVVGSDGGGMAVGLVAGQAGLVAKGRNCTQRFSQHAVLKVGCDSKMGLLNPIFPQNPPYVDSPTVP